MNRDVQGVDGQLADPLSMAAARLALEVALQHASINGWRVSVAVLDAGGHLMAFGRSTGAPLHTIDLAQDKALTAVSFALPTADLAKRLRDAPEHVRQCLLLRPRLVPMGGALPLRQGERVVGAIGVSGASEEQDCECAQAGYNAVTSNRHL
ncbi:heme-binding protein [Pseudomonas sp. H9]|uniref:GlcG/HbpS family heme-binding protein n=1 Tax=Pseudomonas sp. H9 TaxID=483968 RepID=UPI001057BAC7|nr:heme-binding protein [Pseudomonas sp. H9]TDF82611.1 heme-binding protein [Pseudomonas sp. H9]